jgi:hypothetical protein
VAAEALALSHALDPGSRRVVVVPAGRVHLLGRPEDRWDLAQLRVWARALRGAPPQAAPLVAARAERLCRGRFLPGEADLAWIRALRDEADDLQRDVLARAASLLERRGERRAAGERLRRLCLPV